MKSQLSKARQKKGRWSSREWLSFAFDRLGEWRKLFLDQL